jgi:Ca2+-binding EF-hand superfamily protein
MQRLREVFQKMDRNQDGVLNIAEFREAMDALGEHLSGAMVAEVCGALDIHGRVDFEQFRDIVEVECMRSRTHEAQELRALLHERSVDHFKDWLDNWG